MKNKIRNQIKNVLLTTGYFLVYSWIYVLIMITATKVVEYQFSESTLIKSVEGVFFLVLWILFFAGFPLMIYTTLALFDYLKDKDDEL